MAIIIVYPLKLFQSMVDGHHGVAMVDVLLLVKVVGKQDLARALIQYPPMVEDNVQESHPNQDHAITISLVQVSNGILKHNTYKHPPKEKYLISI